MDSWQVGETKQESFIGSRIMTTWDPFKDAVTEGREEPKRENEEKKQ